MKLAIAMIGICFCAMPGAAQTVPLTEAERQIKTHISYLQSRKAALDKLYLDRNALTTLNQIRAAHAIEALLKRDMEYL
jgi:hypothetical protein